VTDKWWLKCYDTAIAENSRLKTNYKVHVRAFIGDRWSTDQDRESREKNKQRKFGIVKNDGDAAVYEYKNALIEWNKNILLTGHVYMTDQNNIKLSFSKLF